MLLLQLYNYSDITWAPCCLKLLEIGLFDQYLVRTNIKATGGFFLQKASNVESVYMP